MRGLAVCGMHHARYMEKAMDMLVEVVVVVVVVVVLHMVADRW